MLSRKIFENLHIVVDILALFEQFLGKFCTNFLPLNLCTPHIPPGSALPARITMSVATIPTSRFGFSIM